MRNYKKPEMEVTMFCKESILCESSTLEYSVLKDSVAGRLGTDYGSKEVSIYTN